MSNLRLSLFSIFFIFMAVFAYEITLVAESTANAYASWTIDAFVEDGGVPVSDPICDIKITEGGSTEVNTGMDSLSDRAQYTGEFSDTGTYDVNVTCGSNSTTTTLTINSNSQLNLDLNYVDSVGDSLKITADFETLGGSDISAGTCIAEIYVDDDLSESISMYYNYVDSAFYTSTSIDWSGDYEVRTICSGSEYSQLSQSEYFNIDKNPVTVSLGNTYLSGYFGDMVSTTVTVFPYTASCSSDLGTMYKTSTSVYSLSINLDFIGSKSAVITCSASDYLTKSKSLSLSSDSQPTSLSLVSSPEYPYSFQSYYLTPLLYDQWGGEIYDATCSIEVDDEQQEVLSRQPALFKAPAGPAGQSIEASCSKTGYQISKVTAIMNIRAITMSGELTYSENAKQDEPFEIRVDLKPGVSATCILDGKITSRTGVLEGKIEALKIDIFGGGTFSIQTDLSGIFNFDVVCTSPGYTPVDLAGEIQLTMLSRSEELGATIILTILTIILAVGFVLVRRYL
ncbi:MAG: hypothetical protein GOV00_00475 [Candidatus Altiarchaeota archaeon]|nr:hypothetical protein [Candidatus Altiarchaeota archaeon]